MAAVVTHICHTTDLSSLRRSVCCFVVFCQPQFFVCGRHGALSFCLSAGWGRRRPVVPAALGSLASLCPPYVSFSMCPLLFAWAPLPQPSFGSARGLNRIQPAVGGGALLPSSPLQTIWLSRPILHSLAELFSHCLPCFSLGRPSQSSFGRAAYAAVNAPIGKKEESDLSGMGFRMQALMTWGRPPPIQLWRNREQR